MTTKQTRNMNLTADQLELRANRAEEAKEESFQRCDTDGFLSQWAHGINAQEDRTQAEILRNGGRGRFRGLWTKDGRRVLAKVVDGQWGSQWMLSTSEVELIRQRGKRWLPTGRTSRILSKLGLVERWELAPAQAKVMGSGTGLSGAASCYVGQVRTGDEWGSDAVLAPDQGDTF